MEMDIEKRIEKYNEIDRINKQKIGKQKKDRFNILGYSKNAKTYTGKITMQDIRRSFISKLDDIERNKRSVFREQLSINNFKEKREKEYAQVEQKKAEFLDAYEKINKKDIIALKNAIIDISKLSHSYQMKPLREQFENEEKRVADVNVYKLNEKVLNTEYLKLIKIANVGIDIFEDNEEIGKLITQDKTLFKYMLSLPTENSQGYTYKFYCENLDEEKLKQDLNYQKALLQALETTWEEKKYTYGYIGKILEQKDGSYIIQKSDIKERTIELAEDILWKKEHDKEINEEGER